MALTNRAGVSTRPTAVVWILIVAATAAFGSCSSNPIRSTLPGQPTAQQMTELWVQPGPGRDLFQGVGGAALAPDPAARYTVLEIKRSG